MIRTGLVATLAVVSFVGCGGVAVPVAGHNDPAAWIAGEPDAWASLDLRGLREDPSYAPTMQCPLVVASTMDSSPGFLGALAALPCKDELKAAEHVDVWFRHEEQQPPSSLLVFRAADAAAACLEAGATRTALSPTVTESVRTGTRWARSYVVRGAHGTSVLIPNGAAYARTRDALAAGIDPPVSDALPKGIVARVGTNGDPFRLLETKMPGTAVLDLRGLNRTELTVDTTPGQVAASLRMRFNFPADADRLQPVVSRMGEELRLRGQSVEVGRTDSWSFLVRYRAAAASVLPACVASPAPVAPAPAAK